MPKGGMPKDGGDPSKKAGEQPDADADKLKLGSPVTVSKDRALTIPRSGREVGGGSGTAWPMLTCSNYNSWSLLMRVILQARHLWDVIETGEGDYGDDRSAMEGILQSVPPEMIPSLAVKLTTKEAWDAIATIHAGAARVRVSKAQNLRKVYESFWFKAGETIDEFAMQLQEIVHQLEVLGDPIDDGMVIHKYLRSVPKLYKQIARSIESLLDTKKMSIEELTGRLKVCEEDDSNNDVASEARDPCGKLLLTEEQ
jgi:hypothetical protein